MTRSWHGTTSDILEPVDYSTVKNDEQDSDQEQCQGSNTVKPLPHSRAPDLGLGRRRRGRRRGVGQGWVAGIEDHTSYCEGSEQEGLCVRYISIPTKACCWSASSKYV